MLPSSSSTFRVPLDSPLVLPQTQMITPGSSHATIDPNHLSRYPPTPTQVSNRLCNLVWLSNAVHRTKSCDHLEHLLVLALEEELRSCWARRYSIHIDLLWTQVLRHDASHLLNGTFCAVV